ncbi:hypothetical protein MCOL2_03226 [Listeria fleischmannii FSL S10-1203]|uniref:Uncharacterized protein n=1 Tax=Listeria fleischmannii FSL S10-1203 TaxID=1265822 RepID=W7E1P6_9LIST|nr:hypothetical protein MCOL2_03226 [Listeria fleischmannii FSL S10-1203]
MPKFYYEKSLYVTKNKPVELKNEQEEVVGHLVKLASKIAFSKKPMTFSLINLLKTRSLVPSHLRLAGSVKTEHLLFTMIKFMKKKFLLKKKTFQIIRFILFLQMQSFPLKLFKKSLNPLSPSYFMAKKVLLLQKQKIM